MSTYRKLRWLPEAAAVLLLLVLGLTLSLDAKLQDQTGWIEHTLEVQSVISDYKAAIFAAESDQRGFLLLRDESYLDAYNRALVTLPEIKLQLRSLVADSPEQVANVDALSVEASSRIEAPGRNIANRRSGDEASMQQALQSHQGQAVMLKVRGLLKTLSDNEVGKFCS